MAKDAQAKSCEDIARAICAQSDTVGAGAVDVAVVVRRGAEISVASRMVSGGKPFGMIGGLLASAKHQRKLGRAV